MNKLFIISCLFPLYSQSFLVGSGNIPTIKKEKFSLEVEKKIKWEQATSE